MIKIKFINTDKMIPVTFDVVSEHVVSLIGEVEPKTFGFETFKMDGTKLGDFSGYTTVYKEEPNKILYSNDGSVWVEPPAPEPIPDPEPVPPTPTIEERLDALEEAVVELYEGKE